MGLHPDVWPDAGRNPQFHTCRRTLLSFVSPTHDAAATWRPTAGPEVWCRVELLPQTVSFEQESCKRRWGKKVLMFMEFQELTLGCRMYLPGGCQEVCRC